MSGLTANINNRQPDETQEIDKRLFGDALVITVWPIAAVSFLDTA